MSTQKNWNVILGVSAAAAIIIIGVSIFLFSGDDGYSGWDALRDQSVAFWLAVIFGVFLAAVGVVVLVRSDKLPWGNTAFYIGVTILIFAVLFGPFGRACTDKANRGVTAPGHKVTLKQDLRSYDSLLISRGMPADKIVHVDDSSYTYLENGCQCLNGLHIVR